MQQLELDLEQAQDDEAAFVEAAGIITDAAESLEADLAFMACSTVMLDALEFMITSDIDPAYTLMLANQVHAEFLTLLADHGYDLSVNTVN
jgi:hypothetical protein